jgi:acyl-CoA dehydrogenase
VTVSVAFKASPWDDSGPLYEDAHRLLAAQLEEKLVRPGDEALHEAARVGPRMADLGLFKYLVPNALGLKEGQIDVRALCTVREVLAYHSPLADAVFAVQGLCANPLLVTGRDALVARMVKGEKIGGFALTEPEAGSDVASLKSTALRTPDGNGWTLRGEKTFISNVGIAHHFVVFANADPAAGKKGISAFLVPADAPGLELVTIPLSGQHPLGRLLMHDVKVPGDALLGNVGDGLRLALGTLEIFRTSVGAAALGMAWRALDETLRHTTTRRQFGQKLSEMQLVQAAIAEMATELVSSRLLVASVARAKDLGKREVGADVAMAKMHATEAASRIIDRAVQLHGGSGVVSGSKVEELYREVRPLRIYEGATDVLKLMVGTSVVKRHESKAK